MAELSKLLAFMFKEDKEDILAQYNKMLDEAEDERAMLESFGSPTKLAVTISRTYNRAERKLAVASDAKDGAAAAQTEAVSAPVPAAPKAPEAKAEVKAPEAGMSYADIIEEIRREKAEAEGIEYKPIFFNEPEPAPIAPEAEETEEPEEAAGEQVEAEAEPEESEEAADTEAEPEEPAPAEEEAEEAEEEPEQTEEAEDTAEAEPEPEEQSEEEPEESEETEEPEEPEEEELSTEDDLILAQLESEPVPVPEMQYKTNVALLILYLIFAIPIGVALLAADIVAALVIMIVVIAAIKLAVQFIAFAFSSLAIFADIMLCSGAVLIALAVALLLIWLVVLLLLCGLKGIVHGALTLGRRMCVREVTVNE